MNYLVRSYSIADLADLWSDEQGGDRRFELVHAIFNGRLIVTDPVVDSAVLDTEEDEEGFLQDNPKYARCYWASGDEIIFRTDFHTAIWEFIEYGNPKTVAWATFLIACAHLCVRKTSFLQYLRSQQLDLPRFWFSPAERNAIEGAPREELAKSLARIEDDLKGRRDVPSLLQLWFLHDTWTAQQGLMLLSDLSPTTVFQFERNSFDQPIRKVAYLETLDGLERDPKHGDAYERKLAFYESLWRSGDHPERAKPQYFVTWAETKKAPPSWLGWAIGQGLVTDRNDLPNSESLRHGASVTVSEMFGGHETLLLKMLARGAVEWWSSYDKDDPSTAPRSAEVINWFVEQGAPSRVAEVMAQILRADGLPTGPRAKPGRQ